MARAEDRRQSKNGDALNTYLKKISKFALLSREEEVELSKRIEEGEQGAVDEMVNRNLRYVVSVASRYKGCGLPLMDLIMEGNLGLIQAAKRFDYRKDVKFITYAVWWIRQAITHALAEQCGTVRLPIKQAGLLYRIGEAHQELQQSLGREPTSAEIAKSLEMAEHAIEAVLRVYRTHLSLDVPVKDNEDTSYLDLLKADDSDEVEVKLLRASLAQEVAEILEELTEREKQVIRMRFGFEGEPMTLEEIGKRMGLSRERIRQIEKKAKNRIRVRARSKALQDYLN